MPHKNKKGKKKNNSKQKFEKVKGIPSKTKLVTKESAAKQCENLNTLFSSKDVKSLKIILKIKDLSNLSVLIGAVILNKFSLLQKLIQDGYKVNENGPNQTTALMWAVQDKRTDIIELLLSNGADPTAKNDKGYNILLIALENKLWDEKSFVTLWNQVTNIAFVDVDFTGQNGENIILIAVRRQWNELLNILISEKVNINTENIHGTTPLMLASFYNNYNMVVALLEAKAKVLKEDLNQCTALSYAMFHIISKNEEFPHLVVDKLVDTICGLKITFLDFFKTLLKLILNEPIKEGKPGHPLLTIKLSVIPYALRYKKDGLKTFLQVAKGYVREPFLMKHFLIIVNDILKFQEHYFGSDLIESQVLEKFIIHGGADLCLSVLKKYNSKDIKWDCDFICLAFVPLINICVGQATSWMEKKWQELITFYDEYLKTHPIGNAEDHQTQSNNEKLLRFNILLAKIKLEKTQIKTFYIKTDNVISEEDESNTEQPEQKIVPKVMRQKRAKGLKAKISKIKSEDLTQRLKTKKSNLDVAETEHLPATLIYENRYDLKSQQAYDCAWKQIWNLGVNNPLMKELRNSVNYLSGKLVKDYSDDMFDVDIDPTIFQKRAKVIVNEDHFSPPEGSQESLIAPSHAVISPICEPIFDKNIKANAKITKENIHEMMSYSISYLSDLLKKILSTYQYNWELEKEEERTCQYGSDIGTSNDMLSAMNKLEIEQIEKIQSQFDSLTNHLQRCAYEDIGTCHKVLNKLEETLLNHKIRGYTITPDSPIHFFDLNHPSEVLEKKSRKERSRCFPKHVEELIQTTKTMDDFNKIDILFSEQTIDHEIDFKNSFNSYGKFNASYLIKFLKTPELSNPKKMLTDKENTIKNSYHLIPSIMKICDDDEDDILIQKEQAKEQIMLTKHKRRQTLQETLIGISNVESPNKILQILEQNDGNNDQSTFPNLQSRWSKVIKSLQLADDYKILTNTNIRVHNQNNRSLAISSGGNFNRVLLGLDTKNNPLAVKQIEKDSSICKLLKTLINPLIGLRHTNLLHYYTCTYEDNFLILTTPLCEYNMGEYITLVKHNSNMFVKYVDIVKQFLNGLRFLHNRKEPIVHGNLKPSNIFIDVNGIVRLAEFGIHSALYILIKAPDSSIIWFSRETYNVYRETFTLFCTRASDIQVAGMLIYFIITAGKHPYGETMHDILTNLNRGVPHLITNDVDLHDLISWMLLYEPSERPSINQVLSHVFFWSANRKWHFILTCCGISLYGTALKIAVDELQTFINTVASKENIKGKWIRITKKKFPNLDYSETDSDTITGLLRFIRYYIVNQTFFESCRNCDFRNFILSTFPALPLSLYRILESSHWLNQKDLQPFTTVDSYLA